MATTRKRLTLIPDLGTLAVLGRDIRPSTDDGPWRDATQAVNNALAEYASLIDQAAAELDSLLTRAEWDAIAEAVRLADVDLGPILALICSAVEDAEGFGAKHSVYSEDLLRRLKSLTPLHGYAILAACRWRWDPFAGDDIDPERDKWWLPRFRRRAVQE